MLSCVPLSIWELLQTDFKYEGYAARQSEQNQRLDRSEIKRFQMASITARLLG